MLPRSSSCTRWIFTASFASLLMLYSGCGPAPEPMGTLTGTVTSDGNPIGNCKIAIYNPETKKGIAATVDKSAKYTLTEIPFGTYEVRVLSKPTDSPTEIIDDRIPRKYQLGKTSGLSVSIDSAEENIYDIKLNAE